MMPVSPVLNGRRWNCYKKWGSVNPNRKLCKSLQSVAAYYEHWNTALNLPYMTDGVVVKLNSFALQQDLPKVAGLWRLSTQKKLHTR